MKYILLLSIVLPSLASGQATGDYILTRKAATGQNPVYVTPQASGLFAWDGSGVAVGVTKESLPISTATQTALDGKASLSGSYANPSWITSLAWSKLTGTPTTLSGYGITDPVVLTSGSYADPSWITSLAYGKLTGVPSSFTPSAHAASHAPAGSDPLTLSQSQITNLTSDLATLTSGLAGKEPTITASDSTKYWRGDKTWQTLNKSAVGLGNVDNTSDATKFTNTDLTGTPTAPTANPGTNSTQVASTAFVTGAIGNLAALGELGTNGYVERVDGAWSTTAGSTGGFGVADDGKIALYNGGGTLTTSYGITMSDPAVGFKLNLTPGDDNLTADRVIIVPDASGTMALTSDLGSYAGSGTITTVGTVATGTWQGTPIDTARGGLGASFSGSTGVPLFTSGAVAITSTSGTGNIARVTSPTFVTPILGTPTSATLTNATGLPISTGISGLGTGVATALAAGKTGTGNVVLSDSPVITTLATVPAINGGSSANDDLTLQGTSSGTRATSYVNLQPNGGLVGVGTATPAARLDVKASDSPSDYGFIVRPGADTSATFQNLFAVQNKNGVDQISVRTRGVDGASVVSVDTLSTLTSADNYGIRLLSSGNQAQGLQAKWMILDNGYTNANLSSQAAGTLFGSVNSGGNLTLDSTLHATKGNVLLNPSGGSAAVGTSSPSASAKLQADSTTQGFLPPRMTTTQKNAIGSPAEGLVVYDTTLHKLCVFTGTVWETVTSL